MGIIAESGGKLCLLLIFCNFFYQEKSLEKRISKEKLIISQ
jgi:hypothetical protein